MFKLLCWGLTSHPNARRKAQRDARCKQSRHILAPVGVILQGCDVLSRKQSWLLPWSLPDKTCSVVPAPKRARDVIDARLGPAPLHPSCSPTYQNHFLPSSLQTVFDTANAREVSRQGN